MTSLSPTKYWTVLAACGLLLAGVVVVSPGIGTHAGAGPVDVWRAYMAGDAQAPAYYIGFEYRLPRTLLAVAAGATLALCGAVFQTLFRNSLATPYTLGIASGGSLGALTAIKLGWVLVFYGVSSVSLGSLLGALLVLCVLFVFTRGARRLTTNELLLAGVTLGLFCSAMMMLVTSLSDERQTFEIIRWMMGSLDTVGNAGLASSLLLMVPCWIVLIAVARPLNQYVLGEEMAAARGVNVSRLQAACVFAASIATAAVVAICGPIGFVGLVVPHIVGLIVGRDCRLFLPASALVGGVFLTICDWISRLAMSWVGDLTGRNLGSTILPIGVVTAVVGVPIFLVLLRRRLA